ncbi:tol-pal system protein YbgF [Halioglobus japonicus]|uniref:Cell division coordinator CpoB n=1 Tax=Halioglobus japonicus TaxID=930805 RepID=A0AAP8MBA4_9GAMM|nr:tol-pal system protein YbgF [Halioglobus japonicus]AQA19990.1 tol-pal system protein YbgF [Halioglobus japonicus]PLW84605.1 tol-pal system protein YbgF [Halioglobus japonicus]GHD22831.1 tol-pal system protein YbgF [Halioglobus japonicus]
MTGISKWLVAGGLVIVTSPFCFVAHAQDYVDVEAERSGRQSAPQSAPVQPAVSDPYATPASRDPYSVQPAQTYPATSYGVTSAPAAPTTATPPPASQMTSQAVGGQGNVGNLFLQVQQLQQEVMRLNGMVEEQANELRILKAQSLERYVDLDKRLSAGGGSAPTASGGSTQVAPAPVGGGAIGGGAAEIPGEAQAYKAAYSLVRSQQFDEAVTAFNDFLRAYPDGKYAPNAHYWLGELYLVVQPRDLEGSRQAFTLLLDQYPTNGKAPDAMYKLGKVYFEKGNRERAREHMERVISQYGNTSSSAVKLARDFLAQNY